MRWKWYENGDKERANEVHDATSLKNVDKTTA